jgi:hypothetical protein
MPTSVRRGCASASRKIAATRRERRVSEHWRRRFLNPLWSSSDGCSAWEIGQDTPQLCGPPNGSAFFTDHPGLLCCDDFRSWV